MNENRIMKEQSDKLLQVTENKMTQESTICRFITNKNVMMYHNCDKMCFSCRRKVLRIISINIYKGKNVTLHM